MDNKKNNDNKKHDEKWFEDQEKKLSADENMTYREWANGSNASNEAHQDPDLMDPERYAKYLYTKRYIRSIVSIIYDAQKQRIAAGNRLVASFNIKMGQEPSTKQEDMDKDVQKLISKLRSEYKRITDAYINNQASVKKVMSNKDKYGLLDLEYLSDKADYDLIDIYEDLKSKEEKYITVLVAKLQGIPIYEHYLKDLKGCGPLMSGIIISYLDIYKTKYVGNIYKYCGLDVIEKDGKRVAASKMTVEERTIEYLAKDGTIKTRKTLGYNPMVKSKLVEVLAGSFMKARSDWAVVYYDRRNYEENKYPDLTLGHIHKRATRYMIKQWLKELYVKWKEIEGLTVYPFYEQAKLGMEPHHYDPYKEFIKKHPELDSSNKELNEAYKEKRLEESAAREKRAKALRKKKNEGE